MADINYNELTHSIVYTDGATVGPVPDPMFHWDARLSERLTRLHLNPEFSRLSLGLGLSAGGACVNVGACSSPVGRRQQRRSRSDRAAAAASGRYRTQPITFDEIAEVDEDGAPTSGQATSGMAACETSSSSTTGSGNGMPNDSCKESKANFKSQMASFSRSMDGLVPGYMQRAAASGAVLTGSDKENTPCEPDNRSSSSLMDTGIYGVDDVTNAEDDAQSVVDDVSTTGGANFQMPSIIDSGRHRRKRSGRRLRNRNSVPEEVMPEQHDRTDNIELEING